MLVWGPVCTRRYSEGRINTFVKLHYETQRSCCKISSGFMYLD